MHLHTSEISRCASILAKEQIRTYKNQGFTGVCVTDHFLNGNTSVPRELSWKERITLFCKGFEAAKKEGEKCGVDVFFGWEYSYRGTDFLTYGLDKEWLLAHPEIMQMNTKDYCDFVRGQGGFVVQAHPFREARYIEMIRLLPRQVDGVEVLNANRTDFENERADEYADNYNLIKLAGSDNHTGRQPRLCGISSDIKFSSIQELISAVKSGKTSLFITNFKD